MYSSTTSCGQHHYFILKHGEPCHRYVSRAGAKYGDLGSWVSRTRECESEVLSMRLGAATSLLDKEHSQRSESKFNGCVAQALV